MRSVMQHSFAQVPSANINRSSFDRSHGHKTTIDADYLYPILVDEALPGDTFNLRANLFARMSTPIYPIMDNLYLDTFFFAIPIRILWDNFHKFLGAQDDPGDSIDFTLPYMTSTGTTGYSEGSIHDYLGIPPGIPDFVHTSLFHRAYNRVWTDWFRDENLQASLNNSTSNGPDTLSWYALRKRGKRHDYFTSALPWPQKSDTAVSMPISGQADIRVAGASEAAGTSAIGINYSDGWHTMYAGGTPVGSHNTAQADTDYQLYADLGSATSATINAMRLAVTTQQFLERDARGGTRINEIILSHFGVTVPDFRVQRPEYLGGGSEPIRINSVPQTSETNTTPQGTMSAFGTASAQNHGFIKSFTEHCVILGLANIRADLTYQKGVEKMFTRSTRYDFYWPTFAHIGEQAILQQEIELTDPAGGTNEDVWGYTERYNEYRFKPSRISGQFRSTHTTSLDPWHLSEELSSPALDSTFIESNTPMARVEAVPAEPDFILDCYFNYRCVRPMPLHGTPGIARF